MNKEYLKKIFEENKKEFLESEMDIDSPEDLEDVMISYITSNMQYDFDIDIDSNKLFSNEIEKEVEEEIER